MINPYDIKNIRGIDKSGMLDILLDLPRQCERAIGAADAFKLPPDYSTKRFDKIFFTGLGGSAIGGDIVKTYLSRQIGIPIIVNRNYDVPMFVDKNTLSFVCSYSGQTEETLSAYKQIKQKGSKIIIVTSGGALADISRKDKIPSVLIPGGIPPRAAIGYMGIIPLVALSNINLIKNQDKNLKEAVNVLDYLKENMLDTHIPAPKNIAKNIASRIFGKFIIIYAAEDFLGGVVTRMRQELEENSKVLCMERVFPEMNHNEITGWEDVKNISKDFAVIFLRDKDEHPRTRRRIEISKELIERKTKNIIEVCSIGESLLARTYSLIYIGTFISFYLAVLNNVDPMPVNNVTYLKKRLAE